MDSIGSSIKELQSMLVLKAVNLRPAIFPSQFLCRTVEELCTTDSQRTEAKAFLESIQFDEYSMETDIDYANRRIVISALRNGDPVDCKLRSLETMMKLFVLGDKDEIDTLNYRFTEANGHKTNHNWKTYNLEEVCSISYALKVAVR